MAHPNTNADDAKLREAGFDPAAAPDVAIAKLTELLGRAAASELAVARALGAINDPGAAAMLAYMEAGASGVLRREVRRALFRLKQHGIEPATAQAPTGERAAANVSSMTAMLSPIDGEGARIAWILKPRIQGGVLRMWALVSEADGLVGAQNTGMTRRELKNERQELERRAGVKLVEADWRLADYIICEAYRSTPAARRGHVGNFLALRAELIASPPATEFVHPVYAELGSAATDASVELLKEPELIEWHLPAEVIKPYVDEIASAGESVIVLSPLHKQERVNTVVARAAAELLTGDTAMRIRRRLEDTAYYMARDGRRNQAEWAVAAAAMLRDGTDLKQSPFFQALIRTQLGTMVAAEQEKAEQEPRLIMTPAEAMRAREAARMRRR